MGSWMVGGGLWTGLWFVMPSCCSALLSSLVWTWLRRQSLSVEGCARVDANVMYLWMYLWVYLWTRSGQQRRAQGAADDGGEARSCWTAWHGSEVGNNENLAM